jgi:DNA gyrase subunit A
VQVDGINYPAGPGKGVILITLNPKEDRVLRFIASVGDRDLLTVETGRGAGRPSARRSTR